MKIQFISRHRAFSLILSSESIKVALPDAVIEKCTAHLIGPNLKEFTIGLGLGVQKYSSVLQKYSPTILIQKIETGSVLKKRKNILT